MESVSSVAYVSPTNLVSGDVSSLKKGVTGMHRNGEMRNGFYGS